MNKKWAPYQLGPGIVLIAACCRLAGSSWRTFAGSEVDQGLPGRQCPCLLWVRAGDLRPLSARSTAPPFGPSRPACTA